MANGPPTPDIGPPPDAGGLEAPPPSGREAPLRQVPPRQTPEEAAAKAEATRVREAERQKGAEGALEQLAGQQPPEARPDDTIRMPGSNTGVDNTPDSFDSRNITNTPGEGKGGDGTEEPEDDLTKLTADQLLAERIAADSAVKVYDQELQKENLTEAQRQPLEESRAKALQRLERIDAATPPQVPEATDAKPDVDDGEEVSDVDKLGQDITQEAAREAAELARIARMPEEQRERELNTLNATLDKIIQNQALTLDENRLAALDILSERAQNRINLIQSAPPPTEGPTQRRSTRVTAEQLAEADRRLKANLEDLTNLAKKSADELGAEHDSEQAKLEALHRMESGPLTTAEEAAVKAQIRDSEARVEAINKLKTQKAPEEEKKAEEKAGEEAKTVAEESKKLRREAAPVSDLQTEEDHWKGEVKRLDEDINNLIKQGGDKSEIDKKIKELRDARTDLKNTQEARKAAGERERNEKGIGQKRGEETVRVMTQAEFDQLDPSAKVEYLIEVANAVDRPRSISNIRTKLNNGENLTFKEAGQLIREVSDSLFEKGKSAESMKLLHQALNSQPEIGQAILDRVTQREDVKKAVDELYPGMGKKIWDFARKYPGWLMILLAALAAGTAVVTVGAGPILGVGVGAAGIGGGAFGLNKKARW